MFRKNEKNAGNMVRAVIKEGVKVVFHGKWLKSEAGKSGD
jgi:hypothetical protein